MVLGAAIDPWFYNVLAGIKPDENNPGFKKFIINPYIPENDLDWVNASVHSMHGTISSSWEKKEGGILFDIKIPANTMATVYLPSNNIDEIREGGKPVSRIKEIKILGTENGKTIMELGSGSYSFSISDL